MIAEYESSTTEFKRTLTDGVKRTVIAFANTNGGDLYIGVDDDGTPVGVDDIDGVMGAVGDMIRNSIRPDLTGYTAIEVEHMADGQGVEHPVIHVTVLRGARRPYYLYHKGLRPTGVFVRHGASSVAASDEVIRQLIRESDGVTFDSSTSLEQRLTFDYAERYFRDHDLEWNENRLRTLGLIDADGLYTNTALLLSDQCRHTVKCAVFAGANKQRFVNRQEFGGSILRQLEETYRFLDITNPVEARFDGLHRIDRRHWPPFALREGLINALTHRDYDHPGSTFINVYSDRMEFTSFGALVPSLTLADVSAGVSAPRNAVLANVLYRLHVIESYGIGIPRIIAAYEDSPFHPRIHVTTGTFTLTLPCLANGHDGGRDPRHGIDPDDTTPPTDAATTAGGISSLAGTMPPNDPQSPRMGADLVSSTLDDAPCSIDLEPAARATFAPDNVTHSISLDSAAQTATLTFPDGSHAQSAVLEPLPPGGTPDWRHAAPSSASSLERLTMQLLRQAEAPMPRRAIETALGVDKNRMAYVLRKLERQGAITTSGGPRNTVYALA